MRICQQLNKHVSQRALLPDPVWQSLSLSLGCSYNIYIPKKERKNIFVEYINFHIIKREKSVGLGKWWDEKNRKNIIKNCKEYHISCVSLQFILSIVSLWFVVSPFKWLRKQVNRFPLTCGFLLISHKWTQGNVKSTSDVIFKSKVLIKSPII